MEGDRRTTRRSFYQRMIFGATSLITATLALPAVAYLFSPFRGEANGTWAEAGDVNELPLNEPTELLFHKKRADGWKTTVEKTTAWAVKSENEVIAFAPHCTHLGCGYQWDKKNKNFLCPCHASTFSIDGRVLSGPAPRPLDRLETRVEGTRLWLGDKKPFSGETPT